MSLKKTNEGGIVTEMKISALAPWFGSKRGMAPEIVRQLGQHRCYWEPFCGSMAVLLAKPAATMETVNDLHDDLINLAMVIRDRKLGPALYRRLRRTLAHVGLLEIAQARVAESPDRCALDRAEDYFIASWLGRNGVSGTACSNQAVAKRFTANGGQAGTRLRSAISSIPAWSKRMAEVLILHEDGIGLLERIADQEATAIYVDPPYLVKGASYIHDFKPVDHERLAAALRRFKAARVVVSYYADPLLAKLYPGWTLLDCSRQKSMVNAGRRDEKGGKIAPEVLLINGPAVEDAALKTAARADRTLLDSLEAS